MDIILSAVSLGFVYGLMALGIFLSYRILDVADLTVDGSFTLGAAVAITFTLNGHPIIGVLLAILSGMVAGLVTAFLQTKLRINPILAGILTMTGLYSINLRIMDKTPNLPLKAKDKTIFSFFEELLDKKMAFLVVSFLLVLIVVALLIFFFKTHVGLSVRATGNNEDMVRSSSINADAMKMITLALANGLVALSGAVYAQEFRYADINMGTGTVIFGLASLIIGEVIIGKRYLIQNMIAVVIGSVVYRLLFALVLELGVEASDIKLLSAVVIILSISYPVVVEKIKFLRQKSTGNKLSAKKRGE